MGAWGANGFGVWTIRDAVTRAFVGITGLQDRPDGRGVALRFALWPEAQGRGLAREAASAALRFGHERVGLTRIVAVAREVNFASRMVLGGIGTLFGDAGINIATFHLGRAQVGGDAIALIEVDQPIPAQVLAAVRAMPQVVQAKPLAF